MLSHLERLHDTLETPAGETLHYWWIYATPEEYPEHGPPADTAFRPYHASDEGVACVDDVARIAVAYLAHHAVHGDEHSRERARQALEFVRYMQHDDGTFLNFVTDPEMNETVFGDADPESVEGVRVNGTPTSKPALEFWASRACWALGEGYAAFADRAPEFAASLADCLGSYLAVLEADVLSDYGEYDTVRGRRVPAWLLNSDSYATAPTVLGLASYCRAADDGRAETVLRKLADGIHGCRDGDALTYPFGAHLSTPRGDSWHTWGLRQAAALARAGDVLDEDDYVSSARRAVTALYTFFATSDVQVARMGPAPIPYHQLSYGMDALVQGCTELWRATDEPGFAHLGGQLASWYHGNNLKRTPVWDAETGRGFDGIYQDTVDWRSGAESTAAAVRTMLDVEQYPESARLAAPLAVTEVRSFTSVDTESGETDPKASRLDEPTGSSMFSGGRVVKLFDGGSLTLAPDLDAGEYRPYIVYKEMIGRESTVVLSVGDQRRTLEYDGGSATHFWMASVDPVELSGGEAVTVEYHGPLDRWGKLDTVVFQPAVSSRVVEADGTGRAVGVARSFVESEREVSIPLPDGVGTALVAVLDDRGHRTDEYTVSGPEGDGLTVPVEGGGVSICHAVPPEAVDGGEPSYAGVVR